MTGRLNKVDLSTDLILIALKREGPMQIEGLAETLADVNLGPFVFDEPFEDDEDLTESLGMFAGIGFVKADLEAGVVSATDRGQHMAGLLEGMLDVDQEEVLRDAGVTR